MWVPYIEKAFAKLYGCYFSLTSGFLDDGVCDMTGMVCEKIALQDKNGDFVPNDGDTRAFWDFLKDQHSNGSLMGCSVAGQGTEMSVRDDMGKPTGLLAGHAYSINDVFEIESDEDDPKFPGEKRKHRLLRIRNPWGKTEWAGKWSA
jgi:calpain, invertebrate